MLYENGQLDFDDQIDKYLPESMIKGLHIYERNDYSKDISIAHLLQHTSGLPDYFTDKTLNNSPNIINQILSNKEKLWTPAESIQFTKVNMKPHFAPGYGFYYSDTGYVLLALIVENVSGLSLDKFFDQFIFKPLNMKSSYLNLKSLPKYDSLPMAKFYAGEFEVSRFKSLSADWGGGGLVSTSQDLIRFLLDYLEDELLQKQTRLRMQDWVYEAHGMTYGFGIRKVSFKDLFDEDSLIEVIGHTGATGSFLWYCPQLDTYISRTLNQLEASKNALVLVYDILELIDNQ
jgi:CubicO group peptidase (beta-lactamase class C family)